MSNTCEMGGGTVNYCRNRDPGCAHSPRITFTLAPCVCVLACALACDPIPRTCASSPGDARRDLYNLAGGRRGEERKAGRSAAVELIC